MLEQFGSSILKRIQNLALYRRSIKFLSSAIIYDEANKNEMLAVQRWLKPKQSSKVTYVHDPHVKNFCAKHKHKLVGFIQMVFHPAGHFPYTGYWLFSLIVRRPWRGMGIGEQLSQRVIDAAREANASKLRLIVYTDNDPAIRLYNKLGFYPIKLPEFEEMFELEHAKTNRRRILMQKRLD